jgi:hypothetical protein
MTPDIVVETSRVSCRYVANQVAKKMYPAARKNCWAQIQHIAQLPKMARHGVRSSVGGAAASARQSPSGRIIRNSPSLTAECRHGSSRNPT